MKDTAKYQFNAIHTKFKELLALERAVPFPPGTRPNIQSLWAMATALVIKEHS